MDLAVAYLQVPRTPTWEEEDEGESGNGSGNGH
jgi:hypothetical protein